MSSPNRGEIWLVDLGYAAKVRPCLVISIPASMDDRALATLFHTQLNQEVFALKWLLMPDFSKLERLMYKI